MQLVVDEAARREQVPKLAECELQGVALGVADGGAAELEEERVRAQVARRERLAERSGSASGAPSCSTSPLRKRSSVSWTALVPWLPWTPCTASGGARVAVGDVVEEDIEQRRRRSIGRRRPSLRGGVGRLARRRLVRVAEAGGEEEADEGVEHGRAREEEEPLEPLLGRVRLLRVQHKPARHPHHHRPRRRRRRRRGRSSPVGSAGGAAAAGSAASRSNAPSTWRRRRIAGTLNDGAGSAARSEATRRRAEPPPAAWRSGDANAPLGSKRATTGRTRRAPC